MILELDQTNYASDRGGQRDQVGRGGPKKFRIALNGRSIKIEVHSMSKVCMCTNGSFLAGLVASQRECESVENCDWHFRYQSGWRATSLVGSRNISVVVLGGRSFDRLGGDSEVGERGRIST